MKEKEKLTGFGIEKKFWFLSCAAFTAKSKRGVQTKKCYLVEDNAGGHAKTSELYRNEHGILKAPTSSSQLARYLHD